MITPKQRRLYGLSALAILGLVLELWVSVNREGTVYDSILARGLNYFVFFTIWSNIAVVITSILVARSSKRNELFWGIRLAALGCIGLTFIIHRLFLAGPLTGLPLVSDTIVHIVVPFGAVGLWLFEGERKVFTGSSILLSLLLPNAWVAFTFVRAALTDYYPYSFLDIGKEGLQQVAINLVMIYAVLYAIICILWYINIMHKNKN